MYYVKVDMLCDFNVPYSGNCSFAELKKIFTNVYQMCTISELQEHLYPYDALNLSHHVNDFHRSLDCLFF